MENKPGKQSNKYDYHYHRFNSTKTVPINNFGNNNNKKKNEISNTKNDNAYKKPKLINELNNDINNNKNNGINDINSNLNENNIIDNENNNKTQEEINKYKKENEELSRLVDINQKKISDLTERCNVQKNMIDELIKKIEHIKGFIPENSYRKDKHKINDKLEEKLAIAAVEEQIIKELCSNDNQVNIDKIINEENDKEENNKIKDKIKIIPQIYYKKNEFENSNCSICFDEFKDNELLKQLKCGHIFHQECLNQWLINMDKCPFCNQNC